MVTLNMGGVMYLNTTVKIPEIKGKIITKKKGTTTYILYQYGSEYRPEKQYSVPLRTIVGKISSSDSTLMIPNEKFQSYFPDVKLPEGLTIEWWNDENLYYEGGLVDYTPPYLNRVYLCSQLGKPEYEYEEEGDERDGYFFPELQLSEKRYRFQFLAPEYLCDALRIAQVSDHVRVSASGLLYDCDQITISVNWQTQGNIASVEVEFECATVVKNIGVSAPLKSGAGDYNDDYNNDYNNE